MQTQRAQHPSDAFGGENVTLRTIAAQVEAMKVRALSPSEYDDVITLLEFMRDEVLKTHASNTSTEKLIAEREKAVTKREHDVALRARLVEAAIKASTSAKRRRWLPWR